MPDAKPKPKPKKPRKPKAKKPAAKKPAPSMWSPDKPAPRGELVSQRRTGGGLSRTYKAPE